MALSEAERHHSKNGGLSQKKLYVELNNINFFKEKQ